MPSPRHAPPATLAREILARADAGERVPKQALSTARRIAALPSLVASSLESCKAPYRVAAWIAWGKPDEIGPRAELATLLWRHRWSESSKGWPDVQHLKAAFIVYREARGSVGSVPIERYLAAVDAVPKRRRDASPRPAAEESTSMVATQRPRRAQPVVPLPASIEPTESPEAELERVRAENARLHALREDDARAAASRKDLHRILTNALLSHIESLQRELGGKADPLPAAGAPSGERSPAPEALASPAPAMPATSSLDDEALLGRLLPVFDNVGRAQQHAEQGAPAAAIAEGLRMVLGQLDEALARSGIHRVPSVGHRFDPARHAAVDHVEAPEPAGMVLREALPGYVVGGRLLRAASVVVSKGPRG